LKHLPERAGVSGTLVLLYVPLILLFSLVAAASFLPDIRLWGINHLAFYSTPVRLIALAVIAVSFLPPVSRSVYRLLSGMLAAIRAHRKIRVCVLIAVPLAAIGVFLAFQSATLLLGDGQLIANDFEHALGSRATSVKPDFDTVVLDHHDAKGSTLVYYGAAAIAGRYLGISPVAGIRALNCVLGGILILVLLWIVLRDTLSVSLSIWLAVLILSSGSVQLFFGYVENYTPVLFFAYLYLFSGLMFIHTRRALWMVVTIGCALTALAMHLLGAVLLLSLGLLLAWSLVRNRSPRLLPYLAASLVLLFLIATFVLAKATDYGKHFLPLRATEDISGILTPTHWLDILNELLIVLPTLPLFAVMGILAYRWSRVKRASQEPNERGAGCLDSVTESGDGRWFGTQIEWYWSLLIALPCLVFLVAFRTEIGMARDWDLLSITIVGLLPLALFALNRLSVNFGDSWVPAITTPVLVLSAVLAVAWIGVNASPGRSARRYESILKYDTTRAAYAYEVLARHYYEAGRHSEAADVLEEGTGGSDNLRLQATLVIYYVDAGRTDDAIDLLGQILRLRPALDKERIQLGLLLDRAGRYQDLLPVAHDGTRLHPGQSIYHYLYGKALLKTGVTREGAGELLEAERLGPPALIASDLRKLVKQLSESGEIPLPDARLSPQDHPSPAMQEREGEN